MNLPVLGLANGAHLAIDLVTLTTTRMLVQSNSGGGKSFALRRIIEQTAPRIQQVVIDVEGDFTTLREKFDYVIGAPHGGDAAATPQTASLLARKLRELRVSAVLDIHDLKAHERELFVKRFFEGLIAAPRSLWTPMLVVLDEAQLFCPEVGSSESKDAVIDLTVRGRKRGLAAVCATQRLSKLSKDAAAELLNKLIGRTGLDVDVKRAADELGMSPREAMAALRELEPGNFFVFGPALTNTVTRVRIGPVMTTHPKPGDSVLVTTPEPSNKVLAILQKLGDIPKEAEQEMKTLQDLKNEIAALKRHLTAAQKAPVIKTVPTGITEKDLQDRVEAAVNAAQSRHAQHLDTIREWLKSFPADFKPIPQMFFLNEQHELPRVSLKTQKTLKPVPPTKPAEPAHDGQITRPQKIILNAMAWMEAMGLTQINKAQVASIAGVPSTSGAYKNNLGRLRSLGLVDYPSPGDIAFTDAGRALADPVETPPTLEQLHDSFCSVVTDPQARILREVIRHYPKPVAKSEVAAVLDVPDTSGAYKNNLGRLRTLGMIEYPKPGYVRAQDVLFPSQ
jgi:hypothetical protein